MVFARYGDDWYAKHPFIAHVDEDGWRVEPLTELGAVYNLAISPDGNTIVYATNVEDVRTLFLTRRNPDRWSAPENLTELYGIVGTYPSLTEDGHLFFFDAEGVSGAGIYMAAPNGDGFGTPEAVYVPKEGGPFDGYVDAGLGSLLVTQCFDDACLSGPRNGIWQLRLTGARAGRARKLPNVPYGWGAQPVDSLGLFVFTDGDDILAIPLAVAGLNP